MFFDQAAGYLDFPLGITKVLSHYQSYIGLWMKAATENYKNKLEEKHNPTG